MNLFRHLPGDFGFSQPLGLCVSQFHRIDVDDHFLDLAGNFVVAFLVVIGNICRLVNAHIRRLVGGRR